MALVSPGVEVSIIDESQYLPAASSSVPLLIIATAQSKANASGTAVAAATTKANANKLYQVTSQRDLVNLYGNPFFYKTTNGTPIHGYELNEYGLLAAYSLLGMTNRCYILRADVDLAGFVGTLSRPSGDPADGEWWLDTTNSMWGIHEFNAVTGVFSKITPYILVNSSDLSGEKPKSSLGNVGEYAVYSAPVQGVGLLDETSTYFVKTRFNSWEKLGSSDWRVATPMVTGTMSNPVLSAGNSFTLGVDGLTPVTITVGANSTGSNVDGLVTIINEHTGLGNIVASNISGKLSMASNKNTYITQVSYITITAGSGPVLDDLGILEGDYNAPKVFYGTSAQMPLWTASQSSPHPTGSVWIKTSSAGNGIDLVLSKYNTATASFSVKNVSVYPTEIAALADLDSTGGKAIPVDTVIATASYSQPSLPIQIWRRFATGPTVFTGTVTLDPTDSISSGNEIRVNVTTPGNSNLTTYSFVNTGITVASFIADWQLANIQYTSIELTVDGLLQITHTEGGSIVLSDRNTTTAISDGILDSLLGTTDLINCRLNVVSENFTFYGVTPNESSGGGTGGTFDIKAVADDYRLDAIHNNIAPMSGYAIGDTITIYGSQLGGENTTNDLVLTIVDVSGGGAITAAAFTSGVSATLNMYFRAISNWVAFDYISNDGKPVANPVENTTWYYSTPSVVDIMVNKNGSWKGYRNVYFDNSGHPAASGAPATDSLGPICAAAAPTEQTDATALVYGDLWVDTSDLENYPMLYRWQRVAGVDQWVLVDKTDQTSSSGIIFEDARWANSGAIDPVDDYLPTITSLLTSDHLDLDAPDPSLYPQGMLLFNTRRSGYNIKEFRSNYFSQSSFPDAGAYNGSTPTVNTNLPIVPYAWVSASGLKADGSAYMGRKAQRAMVVEALKAAIQTNVTIREEDNFFNLISAPGYSELQPDMVTLNNDRHNTAYIVGDTPMRIPDQATAITNWATNAAGATASGEDGWVTRDSYLGVFYPSGITTDLTGAAAVVPASHMMLRTMLRNDTIGYPWFAPAGTRRGTIDNATNIGYLNATTGEFQTIKNRMAIRDVMYTNQINPMAFFTGVGLLNYGNKNSFDSQSALDRINVSRLVAYVRERLQIAARPFVFEPNDSLTRNQLAGVIQSLFIDLVAKRGIYDYLVICDTSNNTPSRIDRNELWVDIAIEPVKAAEFIYIPVRLLNTGELGSTPR